MTRAEEVEKPRLLLFVIALRILGSASEAENAVRQTWLRWANPSAQPPSNEGRLAAEVTRISLDVLRSARPRRRRRAEPLPVVPHQAPERPAELAGSLVMAGLVVLKRLSPLERAVFVLREVFGCSISDIASAVGCSEAACRRLVAAIATAGDGGREPLLWTWAIAGVRNVARLLAASIPPLPRVGVTLEEHPLDGRPGLLIRNRNGKTPGALAFGGSEGRNREIHIVTPDGLGHVDPAPET